MKKNFLLQLTLVIGIGVMSSLTSCTQPLSQTSSVPVETPDESLQQLPVTKDIKFGQIEYIRSETTPNPALERAILKHLNGYTYCPSDDSSQKLRYFYNQIDLNEDRKPETIVYLVGSYTCGTGGCNAFIFQSSHSEYQLISQITLVNNPIIVRQKTKGWHDLILYVAGGGAKSSYHVLRFNGKEYPNNPSVQPSLPSGFTITGKALIADRITFDTPAPILQSENCSIKSTDLLKTESFGDLKIGFTATELSQQIGSPETKGEKVFWGADGLYHQKWYYSKQGITLDMVSATAEEQQEVASMTLQSPSSLKTNRGVGIGDSYTKVMEAYEKEHNLEESNSREQLVVGSIYQGLIFSFENDRVVKIFLGASAE